MREQTQPAPWKRPVKVALEVPPTQEGPAGAAFEITFLPSSSTDREDLAQVLAALGRICPAAVGDAERLMKRLRSVEGEFLRWLQKRPGNAALFAKDPAAALRKSRIDPAAAEELLSFQALLGGAAQRSTHPGRRSGRGRLALDLAG